MVEATEEDLRRILNAKMWVGGDNPTEAKPPPPVKQRFLVNLTRCRSCCFFPPRSSLQLSHVVSLSHLTQKPKEPVSKDEAEALVELNKQFVRIASNYCRSVTRSERRMQRLLSFIGTRINKFFALVDDTLLARTVVAAAQRARETAEKAGLSEWVSSDAEAALLLAAGATGPLGDGSSASSSVSRPLILMSMLRVAAAPGGPRPVSHKVLSTATQTSALDRAHVHRGVFAPATPLFDHTSPAQQAMVAALLTSLEHPYLSRVYECGFGLDKTSFFVCRFFSKDGYVRVRAERASERGAAPRVSSRRLVSSRVAARPLLLGLLLRRRAEARRSRTRTRARTPKQSKAKLRRATHKACPHLT